MPLHQVVQQKCWVPLLGAAGSAALQLTGPLQQQQQQQHLCWKKGSAQQAS
jgi:hypothetical protein